MGGRQGRRLRARGARRGPRCAGGGRRGTLRRHGAGGDRVARRVPRGAHTRHGADGGTRAGHRPRGPARARRGRRPDPRGRPRAPEARHRDGALRLRGAPGAHRERRRPHDTPGDGRHGHRLRRPPARALPRGDRPLPEAHPPRGELGRRAPHPRRPLRGRPLRRRAVRPLAVRDGSRGEPARAGSRLAQPPGPGQGALPRGEHRLRPALRRRASHLDRARPRRLCGRLPPRPDRHRGVGRRRALQGGRDRVHGLVRGRAAAGAPRRRDR